MTIDHMSLHTRDAEPRPQRQKLPTVYVGLWTGLAAISAGYLTVSALDGGLFATGPSAQAIAAANATSEAARRADENRKLRDALSDFQSDVGRVRAELEQKGAAGETIGALAAIEERASIETGKPVEKRTAFVPPAAQAALPQPAIETGSIAVPPAAVKPAPARPAAPAAAAPVTTTAVAAPPVDITFGAPVVKAAPKPFGIQLGSGASLDQIRATWTQIAAENPDALKSLQPRYTSMATDAAGSTYDLFAGPFKSAVDARKACKSLAARGVDCKVTPFGGDAL